MLSELLGGIGGHVLGGISDVLGAPKKYLANPILSAIGAPTTGEEFTKNLGMGEGIGSSLLGFGYDTLTDPLTYAGGLIGKGAGAVGKSLGAEGALGQLLGRGASEGSKFSKLKGLREEFPMFKRVTGLAPELQDEAAALASAGELGPRATLSQSGSKIAERTGAATPRQNFLAREAIDDAESAANASQSFGGSYFGDANLGFSTDPISNRHEVTHGLIRNARDRGKVADLPFSMRPAALLQQSETPFTRGLGKILDETVAHAAEKRGLTGQLQGAYDFLANPSQWYFDQFVRTSPGAAHLYMNLPNYARRAGIGLGAGAAGAAGYGLLQGDN